MPRDLDSSYRKMDGMMECPNGCGYSPYNPGKKQGTQCQHCGCELN